MVGEDHGLATCVQAEAQGGAQNSAESLQKVGTGAQQLFGRQKNCEDQNPSGQKGWDLTGTVQPIPATFLSVAALVTAAICKVVGAVLLINWAGDRKHKVRESWGHLNAHTEESSTGQCSHGVKGRERMSCICFLQM